MTIARPRTRLGRLLSAWYVWPILAGVILGAAVYYSIPSHADPLPPNCQQQAWLYGGLFGRWTTRTLCDGPIHADGSWIRARNFYAPATWVPVTCSWGTYGGSCYGGYPLGVFDTGIERYMVTPDTLLGDEPPHIGAGGDQLA